MHHVISDHRYITYETILTQEDDELSGWSTKPLDLIPDTTFIQKDIMATTDEAYERIFAFTEKLACDGELDFTFSELQRSFPDLDAAEIIAKLHLLKDAWVINEISPNCFTINKILLVTAPAGRGPQGVLRTPQSCSA